MKNTKRFLALLLCFAMILSFAACANKAEEETDPVVTQGEEIIEPDVDVKIAALKGPTGIGMAGFLQKSDHTTLSDKFKVTIAGSPNEIPPMIIKGEADIAACPVRITVHIGGVSGCIRKIGGNKRFSGSAFPA